MGDNMNNEEMGYPGQRFSAGSGSSSMDPFAPNPAALQYVPNEFGITHSETSPMYRYNNPAEPDSGAASQTDNYYPGQQYGQNHQYGQNQMYGQNPQYGQNQMYGQSQPYGQGYDQETMNPQGKKAKSSGIRIRILYSVGGAQNVEILYFSISLNIVSALNVSKSNTNTHASHSHCP